MQASKTGRLLKLESTFNQNFVRTVTLSKTVVSSENDVQLKSVQDIPGPKSFFKQLLDFLPGGAFYAKDGLETQKLIYQRYGPIMKLKGLLGSPDLIMVFDPESCAQVLRGENSMPNRPGFESLEYFRKKYDKNYDPSKPTGLLSEHDAMWKSFRSTVNPILLQPKTIKLYKASLDEVAKDMIVRMKSTRDEKNMLKGKFDEEMNLWALESIGLVALGRRLNCLDPNLPADSPARRLIQIVHEVFKISEELDFKPNLWRYYATRKFKRAMKLYEEQKNINKYFVSQAIEQLKTKEKSDDEKGVLEKLLEIDENIAVIMASDMLFAGVDTAANTVIATLYFLATNPEKQNKLREEILADQERRPYLKACIKESIRIMPVVGGNIRETTKEYNLMGYKIPKKSSVAFGNQLMSVLENQYPEPTEYIPERWLVDKFDPIYHGKAHPFSYMPFGFGVRSCIGRRIAELEMETFVTRLIENFNVGWFGPPLKMRPASLNYMCEPFNFILNDI